MTNFELKKKAVQIIERGLGFKPTTKQIILLEAQADGKYILWSIGNNTYSYNFFEEFLCVYPNLDSKDGIVIKL